MFYFSSSLTLWAFMYCIFFPPGDQHEGSCYALFLSVPDGGRERSSSLQHKQSPPPLSAPQKKQNKQRQCEQVYLLLLRGKHNALCS